MSFEIEYRLRHRELDGDPPRNTEAIMDLQAVAYGNLMNGEWYPVGMLSAVLYDFDEAVGNGRDAIFLLERDPDCRQYLPWITKPNEVSAFVPGDDFYLLSGIFVSGWYVPTAYRGCQIGGHLLGSVIAQFGRDSGGIFVDASGAPAPANLARVFTPRQLAADPRATKDPMAVARIARFLKDTGFYRLDGKLRSDGKRASHPHGFMTMTGNRTVRPIVDFIALEDRLPAKGARRVTWRA